ncbi:MAG: DUF2235 domain-containing protein [Gammaproteobacteria bacterium]|nr:DUF2235 domain-containing protein [Gammaproteobacteria bacterium]
MTKRIVVCLDGTWNSEEKHDSGAKTNVARLYGALQNSPDQIAQYFPGVGTAVGEKVSGGVFGWRLFDQIKEPYRYIVKHFAPGDHIYIFGFSRGAYSARSLAGMITRCGVLRNDVADVDISLPNLLLELLATHQDIHLQLDATDKTFAMYKYAYEPNHRPEAEAFKKKYCQDTNVRLVGVWDTVGALGIPNALLLPQLQAANRVIQDKSFGFLDTQLSARVDAAYHAVALDERRDPFLPTLWTEAPGTVNRINVIDSKVEQVWFVGAHSNVGGGYVDTGLSDIVLKWMIERAQLNGLQFAANAIASLRPNPIGKRYDSLGDFLDVGDKKNRVVALGDALFDKIKDHLIGTDRSIPPGSCLHESVNRRLAAATVGEPQATAAYHPPSTLKLQSSGDLRSVDLHTYRIVT